MSWSFFFLWNRITRPPPHAHPGWQVWLPPAAGNVLCPCSFFELTWSVRRASPRRARAQGWIFTRRFAPPPKPLFARGPCSVLTAVARGGQMPQVLPPLLSPLRAAPLPPLPFLCPLRIRKCGMDAAQRHRNVFGQLWRIVQGIPRSSPDGIFSPQSGSSLS